MVLDTLAARASLLVHDDLFRSARLHTFATPVLQVHGSAAGRRGAAGSHFPFQHRRVERRCQWCDRLCSSKVECLRLGIIRILTAHPCCLEAGIRLA